MSKQKQKNSGADTRIAENRKARHEFFIEENGRIRMEGVIFCGAV